MAESTTKKTTKKNSDESVKALAVLRKVEGFDPASYCQEIQQADRTGKTETVKFLPVEKRKEWFLRWCEENGKQGFLDESSIEYDQASCLLKATGKVVVDNEVIGIGVAAKYFNPAFMNNDMVVAALTNPDVMGNNDVRERLTYALNRANGWGNPFGFTIYQEVATLALGRALNNCGFGISFASVDDATPTVLPESPLKVETSGEAPFSKDSADGESANPMLKLAKVEGVESKKETPAEKVKEKPQQETKPKAEKLPDVANVATKEEALKLICPLGDSTQGKTLGQIKAESASYLSYFADMENKNPLMAKYPNLKNAARLILAK